MMGYPVRTFRRSEPWNCLVQDTFGWLSSLRSHVRRRDCLWPPGVRGIEYAVLQYYGSWTGHSSRCNTVTYPWRALPFAFMWNPFAQSIEISTKPCNYIVAKSGLCRGSISVLSRSSQNHAAWVMKLFDVYLSAEKMRVSYQWHFPDWLRHVGSLPARFYRFGQSSRKWKMDARVGSLFSTMAGLFWVEISGLFSCLL